MIREAMSGDVELVADLIRRSFADVAVRFGITADSCPTHPSNCTPAWIAEGMGKGARYFVLEDGGRACGCVAMEPGGVGQDAGDGCLNGAVRLAGPDRQYGRGRRRYAHRQSHQT
ncbi:MAG TPA: hypothetical protein VMZ31_18620 [Phycisphaerae bacterium]|nr:hypothetical protein [Phycisphaerae bacterium]